MESKQIKGWAILVAGIAGVILALKAFSKKRKFRISTVVPAATGYAKIRKDENENYTVEVKISDLPDVERLSGNLKSYVVWMIGRDKVPVNIGKIQSVAKRFSGKLKASLSSVLPSRPKRIFITAEEDSTVSYPGDVVVLST